MPTESRKASAKVIDLTNVRDGGARFTKKRVPAGDYRAKVIKVEDTEVKRGDNKGAFQWLFTIQLADRPTCTYPYYCQLAENQLWKVRNLLLAAGINVPKKKVKLDPEKVVGKLIAVTMDDAEYEGKQQSEVAAVFPVSEMEAGADEADDDDDEEDEDEDEDEDEEEEPEPPKVTKKAAKKAQTTPEPEPEEDEDEDEEEGDDEDEDDEDEEEPPPPPKKKAAKKVAGKRKVSDEELEELDIDDL